MAEEGTSTDGVTAGPTLEMVACIQKVVEEMVKRLVAQERVRLRMAPLEVLQRRLLVSQLGLGWEGSSYVIPHPGMLPRAGGCYVRGMVVMGPVGLASNTE